MIQSSIKTFKIIFRCAPIYAILWIMTAVVAAAGTALSLHFLQELLNQIVTLTWKEDMRTVLFPCLKMFLSLATATLCSGTFNGMFKIGMEKQMNKQLVPKILEKFEHIEYKCYETPDFRNTLELMSKKPEEKILRLYYSIMSAVSRIFNICGMAWVFLWADWRVAVTFVTLFVPLVWLNFKTADMMNAIYEEQTNEQRSMKYLEKLLSERESLFELRIFQGTGYLAEKWKRLAGDILKKRIHVKAKAHNYYLLGNILTFIWLTMILLLLSVETLKGEINFGTFVVLLTTIGSALDEEDELYMALQQIRWQAHIVKHYFLFMELPEISEKGNDKMFEEPCIVFEHVSFSYPGSDKPILKDVNFEIQCGEHIALVGENGAGKSTIIKLLCRLYPPDKGRILINGEDIWTLSMEAFHRIVSVVFQDFCHYSLSLRENVTLGDLAEAQNDAKIEQALRQARAEKIANLSDKLGKLEEGAKDLSGGEWQRVAIARAFFKNSQFVLLDEPTASLDPLAESDMYHNMLNILNVRGCIFCSHRLASAKLADCILVMKDGVVEEKGNHQELMSANGYYANMYRSQSEWYERKETSYEKFC